LKKSFIRLILLAIAIAGVMYNICLAKESGQAPHLQAIEFFTGFAGAKLIEKDSYNMSPFMVDFDFDLKPAARKINFNPKGLFQFQLEPFISYVFEPNANIEIGNGFILKLGLLQDTAKFQPYIKLGPGIVYITMHTREQSTQFNFFQYGATGLHYFFKKNTALTFEYRFRHLSNASIETPNKGIESHFALIGIAYQF